MPSTDTCLRAIESKDARFDGWFFTAVKTTRIYCRPSCPARTPFVRNVEFLPNGCRLPEGRVPRVQAVSARRVAGFARVGSPR